MAKLVSIIIPIFNVATYLDKCVESARTQTYPNVEILLVDDGSTDACPEICDEWAKRDCRIKVIHKSNGGLSDARNAGLNAATGEYIYFLDGDDYIEKNLLETVVPYLNSGASLVSFRYYKERSDGIREPVDYRVGEYVVCNDQERLELITEQVLSGKIGWEAWSRIYVRSVIAENAIRFADNKTIFAEDLYFMLCYCAHVDRLVALPDYLYHYIIRDNSIMADNRGRLNVGRFNRLSKEVLNYYLNKDNGSPLVKNYRRIHFLIFFHQRHDVLKAGSGNGKENRAIILQNIEDKTFFFDLLHQFLENESWRPDWADKREVEEVISLIKYLMDGNYLWHRIRNRLLYNSFHKIAAAQKAERLATRGIPEHRDLSDKPAIIVLGTEEFGNIGDHQINESMIDFLHNCCPHNHIIEITAKEYYSLKESLKRFVCDNDLIVFAGGGNIGDVYPVAHNIKIDAIETWKNNWKIIFPQTLYFTKTDGGKNCLAKTITAFSKEKKVILFTREGVSFEKGKDAFDCEQYLCPDIVLSSPFAEEKEGQGNVLLCFRRDLEKNIPDSVQKEIEEYLLVYNAPIKKTDLQLEGHVSREDRAWVTKEALRKWNNAQLVITDRLHGMVFAAITGTPCVVFSNYNHKVKGTYEWIKYLPYIRYVETVDEAKACIPELLDMKECRYDNTPLKPYFEKLAEVVKEKCH